MVLVILFVFFKQKTAYEMRISDWSSDVCSSDLRLGAADVGGRHDQIERDRRLALDQIGNAPITARRDGRDGWIPVEAEERHRRGQHAGAFVLRLVEHLPCRRCDNRMDDRRVGRTELVGGHHPPQRGGEWPRSEEHTSELQSLMRISYAVFCL